MKMIVLWALVIGVPVADEPKRDEAKNEAEKLFRKMEEKLDKAKSLECAFEISVPWKLGMLKLDNNSFAGTLFLAEGNKAFLALNEVTGDQDSYLHIVSDGVHHSLQQQAFGRLPYSPKNL